MIIMPNNRRQRTLTNRWVLSISKASKHSQSVSQQSLIVIKRFAAAAVYLQTKIHRKGKAIERGQREGKMRAKPMRKREKSGSKITSKNRWGTTAYVNCQTHQKKQKKRNFLWPAKGVTRVCKSSRTQFNYHLCWIWPIAKLFADCCCCCRSAICNSNPPERRRGKRRETNQCAT